MAAVVLVIMLCLIHRFLVSWIDQYLAEQSYNFTCHTYLRATNNLKKTKPMKPIQHTWRVLAFLILLPFPISFTQAQTVWPKEPIMTNAKITSTGELEIVPSKTSSQHDFEFLAGKWTMHNKKLKTRLNNSTEWEEFESTDENFGMILNGIGNTDIYKSTLDGKPFEGLTLRLFNPKTRLWSLYWVPSNTGVMDPPVVVPSKEVSASFMVKTFFKANRYW